MSIFPRVYVTLTLIPILILILTLTLVVVMVCNEYQGEHRPGGARTLGNIDRGRGGTDLEEHRYDPLRHRVRVRFWRRLSVRNGSNLYYASARGLFHELRRYPLSPKL